MKDDLRQKKCSPCKGNEKPLHGDSLSHYFAKLMNDWDLVEEHHLEKEFSFKNFKQALDFVNKVGALAEQEGHHPDIFLTWGKVILKIWTHKIKGLSENDFILAAKCDEIFKANYEL
ncbi:MAG: 4a-hydroxytetrahydrobiopterin dehydratase [Simkaniaceae bacterium]